MFSSLPSPPVLALLFSGLALLGACVVSLAFWLRAARWRRLYGELSRRSGDAVAALHSIAQGVVLFPPCDPCAHEERLLFCRVNGVMQGWLGLETSACDFSIIANFCAEPDERTALLEAVRALRLNGVGFESALVVRGHHYHVRGQRVLDKGIPERDVVWCDDVTARNHATTAAQTRAARLRTVLDYLPLPLWMRDGAGTLVYGNLDYAHAVMAPESDGESDGDSGADGELLGRNRQKQAQALTARARGAEGGAFVYEDHPVTVAGERRLLRVGEALIAPDLVVGLAQNITPVEDLKRSLRLHRQAQSHLLENLGIAISVFGADLRLVFFNAAYSTLFQLSEDFLQSAPSYGELLDLLHEKRRLPEHANFPAFKRQRLRDLQRLIEPEQDLLHLPNGATLRLVSVPNPEGGVIQAIEDVTDRLVLERSYNTLIEVQRETLDKLYEAVAVYGADGRLKLFNPAFCVLWGLEAGFLLREPHIREVLHRGRHFYSHEDDTAWRDRLAQMVARVLAGEPRSGRFERTDGHVLDWSQVMLPDGSALLTFLDVTALGAGAGETGAGINAVGEL